MPIRVLSPASPEAGPSRRRLPPSASVQLGQGDNDIDDDDDDIVEEEEGWTKETFVNRSLSKNDPAIIPQLRQVVDKLKEAIGRIEEGLDVAKETAMALEDSKQDEPSITEVENTFFRALNQRELLKIKIEVLEEMSTRLRGNEEFGNIEKSFAELADPREKAYMAKSQRAKYKNSKEYVDFRQALWEINHETACPPVSQWLEKGDDDVSDDDDFDMGGQTQNYRCPITLMLYKEATTSTKCGHNYSKAAIEDLIESTRKAKRQSKCPVTGCSVPLSKADLKPNPSLQKRADDFERRQQRREDEREDGDDTIAIEEDDDYE
ncbi:uncharacterized protein L201_003690 [Kwoniella dendrophila CBS 6074]|uniref:SP-RING-type domain-containing protein n=1 Tax=Kwoniella dendrophila CBS 6074 TaxID=1295534 RepID=A0AAX4JTU1_9TREE